MVEAKGNSQCQGPKGDVTLACPAKKPGGRCGRSEVRKGRVGAGEVREVTGRGCRAFWASGRKWLLL